MINFIDGKIKLCGKNILAASNEELNSLAKEGMIKKRQDAVGTYYYVEDEAANMRFGVFVSLQKKVNWARLSWLDSAVKSWDHASDKAMMNEYRILLKFVEKEVGVPPDNKGNRKCTWRFKWGKIEVAYEPRAYQADIFMQPH